jgi:ribosomal-protein-alanine N-acetyltransferase
MEPSFQVRPATLADLATITDIEREVFSDPWSASAFRELIGVGALVAESDGLVAGYVFARSLGDEGEILNLAVRAGRQRLGIGRKLLDACVAQLQMKGARTIYLEVRASNFAGQDFYRRAGFERVGRRRGYYDQPLEDALLFARKIGSPTRSA